MKVKNIDFVYENNLCHFCGTCYAVCPKENIHIGCSEVGNPIFRVRDIGKCGRCDLCYRACPGHEIDFDKLHEDLFSQNYKFTWLGTYRSCFLAHSTDDEIRFNAASGGAVSSILITALERGTIAGALVVKMAENSNPLKTEIYIAKSKEDILRASGSKYVTVPLNIGLRNLWQTSKEEKYAFVGLPCHIHGLRKAQSFMPKLRRRVVLTIAIFCGRNTSPLGTEYVLKKLGVKKRDVAKIDYRKGKWPGNFGVTLKTGEERFLPLNDYIYIMKMFQNIRCGLCVDQTGEFADISAGDAWLPELEGQDGWNMLMTRTQSGNDVVREAKRSKQLNILPLDASKVKQAQQLTLFDKKHVVFPLMKLTKFLSFNSANQIPRYTGLIPPKKVMFKGYFRAFVFYLMPRLALKRYARFLLNILIRMPLKLTKLDFKIVKGENL